MALLGLRAVWVWSMYLIGVITGYGIWLQFCVSFGPQGYGDFSSAIPASI